MPLTTRNYFRHSTAALESALAVTDDSSELYELIEDELDKRYDAAEEARFHSDARDNTYESNYGPGAA